MPVSPTNLESNRSSHSRRTAGVSRRVGRHEHDLDLLLDLPGDLAQHGGDVAHVQGAHVGAARVAEEEERHEAVGRGAKVVRATFGVGQREVGLRIRLAEQLAAPAVIGDPVGLRTNREERRDPEQHDRHDDRDGHRSYRRGVRSGRRRSGRFGGREAHARRQSRTGPTGTPIRRVASANGRFRR